MVVLGGTSLSIGRYASLVAMTDQRSVGRPYQSLGLLRDIFPSAASGRMGLGACFAHVRIWQCLRHGEVSIQKIVFE